MDDDDVQLNAAAVAHAEDTLQEALDEVHAADGIRTCRSARRMKWLGATMPWGRRNNRDETDTIAKLIVTNISAGLNRDIDHHNCNAQVALEYQYAKTST